MSGGNASHGASCRLDEVCGIFELTDQLTQLAMGGAERQSFLHNLCTNEIKRLQSGQGCEAFVTTVQGRCLGHINAFCGDERIRIVTVADQAERLLTHFDRYLITEDVALFDETASRCAILISGRGVADTLWQCGAINLPEHAYAHTENTLAGVGTCQLARVPWIGQPAFLLTAKRELQATLLDRLQATGAVDCDLSAFHANRIDARYPWFGWDVSEENLPQEVDRDAAAISFTKGCYLGQETVARLDALGHVNKRLVLLRSASSAIPAHGSELTAAGKLAGKITSAAAAPTGDGLQALALVRCDPLEAGHALTLEDGSVWHLVASAT